MGTITTHRDLTVWQRSMDLAEAAHRLAAAMPRPESAPITRTAGSVPSGIAEGRAGRLDHACFPRAERWRVPASRRAKVLVPAPTNLSPSFSVPCFL